MISYDNHEISPEAKIYEAQVEFPELEITPIDEVDYECDLTWGELARHMHHYALSAQIMLLNNLVANQMLHSADKTKA